MFYVKSKRSYFLFAPPLTPTTGPPQTIPHPRDQRAGLVLGGGGMVTGHASCGSEFVNSRVLFLAHYNWHVLIQLGNKIELGGVTRFVVYYSYQLPAATPWEWGWRWEQTAEVARCTSVNDRNSHVPWWRVCKVGCRWYVLTLLSISKFSYLVSIHFPWYWRGELV